MFSGKGEPRIIFLKHANYFKLSSKNCSFVELTERNIRLFLPFEELASFVWINDQERVWVWKLMVEIVWAFT